MQPVATVAVVDRPDELGPGTYTTGHFVAPMVAWAWLHTLRTGERAKSPEDIDRWALEEQVRFKEAEMKKPRAFRPRVVQKLRSQKRRPDPGPSVA